MKIFKLVKEDYKDLVGLLQKVGAVQGLRTFPETLYISKDDVEKFKKALKAEFKKDNPRSSKNNLDYHVNMEWLNYGPSQKLEDVIKPGYLLFDDEACQRLKHGEKS